MFITPEAQALIDVVHPVLDQGFVRLVSAHGTDEFVTSSARVSYGQGTKTVNDNKGLINYLVRNGHTSPLEQVNLTFHIKQPIFCERQMGRHRTARRNEISGRYSVMKDELYTPGVQELRAQSLKNKQVGEGALPDEVAEGAAEMIRQANVEAYRTYENLLRAGVAREQARMVLPQNLYTEGYWQFDLHNLFNFLRLRLDWHAQAEIRAYAEAMAACAKAVAPLCYEAFETHVLKGARLSSYEVEAFRQVLTWLQDDQTQRTLEVGDVFKMVGLTERQATELAGKLGVTL